MEEVSTALSGVESTRYYIVFEVVFENLFVRFVCGLLVFVVYLDRLNLSNG